MKRAGRKWRLEQGGSNAQAPMALQPNYVLAGQRAGMGPPFRKNKNQLKKTQVHLLLFLQQLEILGFQVLKRLLGPIMGKTPDGTRELPF